MKLFFSLLMLIAALNFSDAKAQGTIISETAVFQSWDLDAESAFHDLDLVTAKVKYNIAEETLVLTLGPSWSCPPNAMCSFVMPIVVHVFKIQKLYFNSCGAREFISKSTTGQVLKLVDYKGSHCELNALIESPISATLITTENGQLISEDRFFSNEFVQEIDPEAMKIAEYKIQKLEALRALTAQGLR